MAIGTPDLARIALVHALQASMAPAAQAFARGWPQARIVHLLDDSLSGDVSERGIDTTMIDRFLSLGRYARSSGAQGVLFTCSAFDVAIARVRADLDVPVLAPTEAMLDEVRRASGEHVVVLATFEPTVTSLRHELALAGAPLERARATVEHVDGALAALQAGRAEEHDGLVADAAAAAVGAGAGLVALAQFSMARAADAVASRTGVRVLTTPDTAVARLRAALTSSPA